MKKRYLTTLLTGLGIFLALGFCVVLSLVTTGSGLTLWYFQEGDQPPTAAPVTTLRPLALIRGTATATPIPTPTVASLIDDSAPALTPAPTDPPPTEPSTPTPSPAGDTPSATEAPVSPPTDTPSATEAPVSPPADTPPAPAPRPPTETPPPTDTPAPDYAFAIVENDNFPTGKADLDIFIAVTNADNKPVSGYRVIGTHTDGTQVDSPASAGDWTENSGAMHYKAGNIKYSVPNSPSGVWTLQLVDEAGQPAAPPVELPFDEFDPSWYFLLYQEENSS